MNVEIYTITSCPYCARAKDVLKKHSLSFAEIDLTNDPEGRAALVGKAAGRKTVPQIFINGQSIGGCDDLLELEKSGLLRQWIEEDKLSS